MFGNGSVAWVGWAWRVCGGGREAWCAFLPRASERQNRGKSLACIRRLDGEAAWGMDAPPSLMAIHQSISLRLTHSSPLPPKGRGGRRAPRQHAGEQGACLVACLLLLRSLPPGLNPAPTHLPPPVLGLLSSMQDSLALGKALDTAARRHPRRGAHLASDQRPGHLLVGAGPYGALNLGNHPLATSSHPPTHTHQSQSILAPVGPMAFAYRPSPIGGFGPTTPSPSADERRDQQRGSVQSLQQQHNNLLSVLFDKNLAHGGAAVLYSLATHSATADPLPVSTPPFSSSSWASSLLAANRGT